MRPKVKPSTSWKLGVGSSSATRMAGESTRLWGSAIWGEPAKTCGFQNGDWPEWRALARNWTCAWKWAFAS
jgi:hypothetical protein